MSDINIYSEPSVLKFIKDNLTEKKRLSIRGLAGRCLFRRKQ